MYKPFIGVVLLLLVGMGCTGTTPPEPADPTAGTGRQAPAFSLQDYSGNTITLESLEGKHLVINSWAAWCPFCRDELPELVTIQEEFPDTVVIAINRQETLGTAKKYSDELGVTEDLVMLLDPTDSFYRSIGGFSMPETIFVEPSGEIQFHKRGVMALDELRQRTKTLLE